MSRTADDESKVEMTQVKVAEMGGTPVERGTKIALLCVGGYGLVVPSEAGSGIGGGGVLSFMLLAGLLIFFWACHLAVQSDRYGGLTLSAGAQRGEPLRV